MTTGRMSDRSLRHCVVVRCLGRQVKMRGEPTISLDVIAGLSRDLSELDEDLGEFITKAFRGKKTPVPTEHVVELVDLWIAAGRK